ncbi:hypothetical protein JHK85_004037 [Glycine max]|nr:hypothetical protein JHK85_004037 [Glycine max]
MVRIARLWMVSDVSTNKQTSSNKIPFSMEMVLMDSKGDRVHGSIKRTLIYKFDKTLQEEKVALVDNASVPNSLYNFVPIRDIVCGGYDTDYLLDKIHLQNCICGTRVVSNAECEEVKELATRYRIKVRVIDESDSVTFVIFERDATILFYKPCTNTFEIYQKFSVVKKSCWNISTRNH